jgi:gamma-glutamylcyclotransferase (GGCT)/AIG2-like uncharacterized protein YtfP
MADPILHLFVYGSLRSGFRSPAYEYISPFFNFIGEARVRGKMYDMGEYPAAVPTDEDSFIIGELYRIKNESEFSWAIGQLDDYEGVYAEPGEQLLYYRGMAEVLVNNETVKSWMYWYNGDVTGKPQIHSGDVLEYTRAKNK